jgi:hypothetical protein
MSRIIGRIQSSPTSVNHQDQSIFRIPQANCFAIQVTPILIFEVHHTPSFKMRIIKISERSDRLEMEHPVKYSLYYVK